MTYLVFEARSFKPNPSAYAYFHQTAQTDGAESWLSSNPFDAIGALPAEMKAIWRQRSSTALFDPWRSQPTVTVTSLLQVADLFTAEDK